MPTAHLPQPRRPVVLPRPRRPVVLRALPLLVVTLVFALAGLLGGGAGVAAATPYATEPGGPVLTLPDAADFVLGRAGTTYIVEADGDPVPAIGVDRLPPGLRLVAHGDGSATITGTPTGPAGRTTVAVTAQNTAGSTTETLTVTVQQGPGFLDRTPLTFVAGAFASLPIRTTGFPAASIAVEGELPAGLTFADNGDGTAMIAGTPSQAPTESPVTLTAVNVVADVALTTTVRVVVHPDLTGGPVTGEHPTGPRRAP